MQSDLLDTYPSNSEVTLCSSSLNWDWQFAVATFYSVSTWYELDADLQTHDAKMNLMQRTNDIGDIGKLGEF